mmetsp:Transcript_11862/g.21451  ORF Transcript_11862/g.21451 Transcript_11862/m.21451 type:complete len:149 (-) Transcript_11862:1659-2105(-)
MESSRTGKRTAGVVVVKREHEQLFVLMVTARKRDTWILPKGGIEEGESAIDAALREAREEAGVIAREQLATFLGGYEYGNGSNVLFWIIQGDFVLLERSHEEWNERNCRERRWFSIAEAFEMCEGKEDKRKPNTTEILNDLVKHMSTV